VAGSIRPSPPRSGRRGYPTKPFMTMLASRMHDPRGRAEGISDVALFGLFSNRRAAGQLDAINRSQARIEFDLDGNILDANENFLSAMGYSPAEAKGQHRSLCVTPEEKASPGYKPFWADLGRGEFSRGAVSAARQGRQGDLDPGQLQSDPRRRGQRRR